MSSSLIIFQRTRVISSPSISTRGVVILIFSTLLLLLSVMNVMDSVRDARGVIIHQAAVQNDLALILRQAADMQH